MSSNWYFNDELPQFNTKTNISHPPEMAKAAPEKTPLSPRTADETAFLFGHTPKTENTRQPDPTRSALSADHREGIFCAFIAPTRSIIARNGGMEFYAHFRCLYRCQAIVQGNRMNFCNHSWRLEM
ncbi:MAG: hypothetical protein LBU46_03505 [Candidatus Accumulibacter sp.]|jgi:hypothetical protein|nr:hypothetical protein [Accumulibacter sp.]